MKIAKSILRAEAKKVYKERTKGVPKRNRISFSEFFKKYKEMKLSNKSLVPDETEANEEDFDFNNIVNINEISDDNLEEIDDNDE